MRALLIILSLFLFMNTSFAAPYKGDAKTARIPAGTIFQLQLMQTIDTMANQEGDTCNFILLNDQKYHNNVVLPSGSVVRGSIERIKTAKRCSRGAVLYIDFDHIVTPTGRQLPLSLGFVGLPKVTYDGGIYNNKGYGEALKTNWNKCADITKVSTKYGLKAGESAPGIQILTCPICAIGGGVGGAGYLIGDSIIDLCRKGEEVLFTKGTVFQTRLTQPIDVPVN
ncbi:MAG: hypothetical protein ACI4S3_05835 [Candidatus Gastranaerophilaceae bacterium]